MSLVELGNALTKLQGQIAESDPLTKAKTIEAETTQVTPQEIE